MNINRLILASRSKWRQMLLDAAGIEFEAKGAAVDEAAIVPEDSRERARQRAIAKAHAVAAGETSAVVIGADQVLEFNGKPYDKVRTREEARERLMSFSGERHELLSAFCLVATPDLGLKEPVLAVDLIEVTMRVRPLLPIEVERYLDRDEWQETVGCYQYESAGIHLFDSVDGDSSAIIGLPLLPLFRELRRFGINPLVDSSGPWNLIWPQR